MQLIGAVTGKCVNDLVLNSFGFEGAREQLGSKLFASAVWRMRFLH